MSIPTVIQLKRGLQIAEQIAKLEAEMAAIFQGRSVAALGLAVGPAATKKGKKRRLSAQALANIRAAQKKRWANFKKGSVGKKSAANAGKAAPKKKGGLTEEGRKKLAAAMKRRWAAAKAGKAPAPTAPSAKTA